jgi:hypothetical protein
VPKNLVNAVLNSKSGREFCQLRPTFLDKPLLKHHVTLCKRCSPVVALPLPYLEIFELYSKFLSFAILKKAKLDKNRSRTQASPRPVLRTHASCSATRRRPFAPVYGRPRRLRCGPWTCRGPSTASVSRVPHPYNRTSRPGPHATR